jgi:hypothetical protein
LEEEPNPFEQSFTQLKLPSIDSSSVNTSNNTNKWNSLRSGILSPSMLPGPTQTSTGNTQNKVFCISLMLNFFFIIILVVRRPIKYELETTTFYNHTYENPPPTVNRAHVKHTRKMSSNSNYSTIAGGEEEGSAYNTKNNKRQKRATNTSNSVKDPEDEDKRKNFLERNRIGKKKGKAKKSVMVIPLLNLPAQINPQTNPQTKLFFFFTAALKCRQRKKQWLQNLQTKVEYLAAHNEQFHMQANVLREELIQLKTLLMTHKDCPINQENMKLALSRPIPGVPSPASLSHPLLFTKSGGNQQGEFEEEEEEYEDDDS